MLDAINQSDGDRNGTVELNELAAYVYAKVTEVSQKVFKQRQVPQMKITANYPLAKQIRILRDEATPVAETKPTFKVSQMTVAGSARLRCDGSSHPLGQDRGDGARKQERLVAHRERRQAAGLCRHARSTPVQ